MSKNIILLSDGTGNSSSNPFKTNVWRLYQALDINPPQHGELAQVVHYDNGVGTQTFKPLALLGLALGIGLARYVKYLYAFLCRNYQPGDNIYLFGFSRGALTVRILAGLILRCGVVTAPSEDELRERVELAYAEYKRDVARRATATRPLLIAGRILGGSDRGRNTDRVSFNFPKEQHFPRVAFVGVWDTVDAYGMPIDELKMGIDRYIWPMTLADRLLSDHIDRACHALSLDDERPTFRPVLWTDPNQNPARLIQVWFAGVHANVGGGYADDGLAYVALQWMMDEAAHSGLRFHRDHQRECDERADPQGQQHDSRSGVAGYYRYAPRDVDSLCDDEDHGVRVAHPQVHASALERIRRWQVPYAPVSFPRRDYSLLSRAVHQGLAPLPPVESPDDIAGRAAEMELVKNSVFRRRVAYFFTVLFTVLLAVLPVIDWIAARNFWGRVWMTFGTSIPVLFQQLSAPFSELALAAAELSHIFGLTWAMQKLSDALTWMADQPFFLAWLLSWWFKSFANHPTLFLLFGLTVLWLFFRKSYQLQDQIFARAEYAWRRI